MLIAHEILLEAIKSHPLNFFADEFDEKLRPLQSAAYKSEVLELDPSKKSDVTRGSIAWLLKVGAISQTDVSTLREITETRNLVAHEFRSIVSGGAITDFTSALENAVELIHKIEKWWIVNVDLSTDPDIEHDSLDIDGILPGSVIAIRILEQVSSGDDEKAWEYFNLVESQKGEN